MPLTEGRQRTICYNKGMFEKQKTPEREPVAMSQAEFEVIANAAVDPVDEVLAAWMTRNNVDFYSGDLPILIDGKLHYMRTEKEDWGTWGAEPKGN